MSTTPYQEDSMKTATASRRKRVEYTTEQKEEYRKAQREQAAELMKAGVTELLTSEGWQKWAAMRARLHHYSFNNTLLILCQCPEASIVMSGKKWIEMKRRITSGPGSALRVFAPLFRRPTAEEIARGRKPEDKILYSYKLVPVFDVSQTDGEPLPEPIRPQPLDGDSHAAYLRPLEVFAHSLGFSVSYEDLSEGLGGYVNVEAKHIAITKNAEPNQQVKTLIHEIAHALGFDYTDYTRSQAETLVETVAFIVSTSIGLDTSSYSLPYALNFGADEAVKSIETFAATVDKVARQIERAVKDAEVNA